MDVISPMKFKPFCRFYTNGRTRCHGKVCLFEWKLQTYYTNGIGHKNSNHMCSICIDIMHAIFIK